MPLLQREGREPEFFPLQVRIFVAVRDSDEPPVAAIAPRVIGAGQHLCTAASAIDQARTAVTTHVREGSHLAVVAADDKEALAEIFEAAPFAWPRYLAL